MASQRPEIGGFELGELIGRGGFSTVYRAYQPKFNRTVAVKVMDVELRADEDAERRFERECQTIGSLTGHHAVVTVHQAGTCADGQPYIAMELLDGGSLQDRMNRTGPLPWSEVTAIGVQMADALAAAHELGILHRDVKPANVMQDRFGHYKLGDFGIARLAAVGQTTVGAASATIAYAAPEVLLGHRATERSDLYGFGAMLYALLTGTPAFADHTDESVVPMAMRVTTTPAPRLPAALAPAALADLVAQLMAKDPADRPADAADVLRRLEAIEARGRLEQGDRPTVPLVHADVATVPDPRLAEAPTVVRSSVPVAPPPVAAGAP